MPNYKMKVYKFKVTDKESEEITKYCFTKDIYEDLGMTKTSIYDIMKYKQKNRTKYAKYNIEKISEPYIEYN